MPRVQFANPAGVRVEDDEFEKVFTTYSNYLANASNLLAGTYGVGPDLHGGLVAAMRLMPQVQKIQRNKINKAEHSSVVGAMKLSWCHETQLRLRGKHDPELLPDLLHGPASEAAETVAAYYRSPWVCQDATALLRCPSPSAPPTSPLPWQYGDLGACQVRSD